MYSSYIKIRTTLKIKWSIYVCEAELFWFTTLTTLHMTWSSISLTKISSPGVTSQAKYLFEWIYSVNIPLLPISVVRLHLRGMFFTTKVFIGIRCWAFEWISIITSDIDSPVIKSVRDNFKLTIIIFIRMSIE